MQQCLKDKDVVVVGVIDRTYFAGNSWAGDGAVVQFEIHRS
jgi:hypothetical protein